MKRTLPKIESLAECDRSELSKLWVEITNDLAPSVPIGILRHLVAHEIQVRSHGRLKARVNRELLRLHEELSSGSATSAKTKAVQLSAGTRLVREWNGKTILVEVLDDGFRYDNRTWNSLSEIARLVTGTQWSGPRFFGLHKNG